MSSITEERQKILRKKLKEMGNFGVQVRSPEESPFYDQPIDYERELGRLQPDDPKEQEQHSESVCEHSAVRMEEAATTVMERCDLIANISEEPGLIVRPYGSQAMNETNNIVSGWMRMAGMTTRSEEHTSEL